ncbi:hypothetical protein [Streptomyces sp. NPDC014793]|uniref:hypothetical protein n=1 Tax=Streptomyces sp. NPDC014793 TaxID=3364914 RepID=UPI0036F731C8
MTEPPTTHHAPLPLLRAAVFAIVGTVLGVSAHHLVAEGPLPWRQGLTAMAALFVIGVAGARRPRSLGAVMATCGLAQAGLHLWLMTEHGHGLQSTSMTMPGHVHHVTGAHGIWHERLHASPAMTVAHAAVAVLASMLLHRADIACWSLARGLTAAVGSVEARISTALAVLSGRSAPAVFDAPRPAVARLDRLLPRGAVLADVVVRRGPPQAGFAFVHRPCGGRLRTADPRSLLAWRHACCTP